MPSFWKHVFTFGRKTEENEFLFPGFSRRKSPRKNCEFVYGMLLTQKQQTSGMMTYHADLAIEFAYVLRRVELNGREETEGGHGPWSIRQTAVYHKFFPEGQFSSDSSGELAKKNSFGPSKSMFLLLAPSSNVEWMFSSCLDQSRPDELSLLSPWNVHRILIADSLQGWMDYMASLEKRLKHQVSSL